MCGLGHQAAHISQVCADTQCNLLVKVLRASLVPFFQNHSEYSYVIYWLLGIDNRFVFLSLLHFRTFSPSCSDKYLYTKELSSFDHIPSSCALVHPWLHLWALGEVFSSCVILRMAMRPSSKRQSVVDSRLIGPLSQRVKCCLCSLLQRDKLSIWVFKTWMKGKTWHLWRCANLRVVFRKQSQGKVLFL